MEEREAVYHWGAGQHSATNYTYVMPQTKGQVTMRDGNILSFKKKEGAWYSVTY